MLFFKNSSDSLQDIRYFKECGHARCVKCLDSDIIGCYQCKKSLEIKDVYNYEGFGEILTNIEALHNINNYLKGNAHKT